MNSTRWTQVTELFGHACELPTHERQAWLESACPDEGLRRDVVDLLVFYDADPDFLEQPVDAAAIGALPEPDPLLGRVLGQYRLVRQIGRGGMGVVYEAHRDDQEFDRRAAVKILPTWSGTEVAARFRFERRVLAGLDHPGIARLLDAGSTEDGVQYFVMEYVDGEPIDVYCRRSNLRLRDLVTLVGRVLDAVAYAHQHLVIHRDIKPANILVTSEGQPKLLDFGISTLLSGEDGLSTGVTRPGLQSFTPEFASPEQVRGERVTTTSDIYSLGAMLYLLLSGRPPYVLDGCPRLEAIRLVCDVDPPLMSAVAEAGNRERLAGDLDNIVAKALRKDPRERYATIVEFATDLRAWMDGRPVSATPQTLSYRARRFVVRNRAGVVAASAVIVALIAGGTATAWQARIARQERDKAQNRFRQLQEFSRSMLFDVHDALRALPGATEPRRLLLDRAVQMLDGLAADAGDDDGLMMELAEGYRRLATVQGSDVSDNLGDTAGAIASLTHGARLAEQALAARPDNLDRLVVAANVNDRLAVTLSGHGDADLSERARLRHLELLHQLEKQHAGDPRARVEVASGYSNQGILLAQRRDLAAARTYYLEAVRVFELVPVEQRSEATPLRAYTLTLKRLGAVEMMQGALDDSERHYRTAMAGEEEFIGSHPDNPLWKYELTYSQSDLGLLLLKRGNHTGATELWTRALETRRSALALDPKNIRMLRGVASLETRLGLASKDAGKFSDAVAYLRSALQRSEALLVQQAGLPDRILAVAFDKVHLADALLNEAGASLLPKRAILTEEARALVRTIDPARVKAPSGTAPDSEFMSVYQAIRARLSR